MCEEGKGRGGEEEGSFNRGGRGGVNHDGMMQGFAWSYAEDLSHTEDNRLYKGDEL